jgi:hypothetical protein
LGSLSLFCFPEQKRFPALISYGGHAEVVPPEWWASDPGAAVEAKRRFQQIQDYSGKAAQTNFSDAASLHKI